MKWSVPIGRVFGIEMRIHATFLLLLGFVAWAGFEERGVAGMLWSLVAIGAIFTCVGLHELGHSLVAQRLGVQVRSIVFLPIGGVAGMRSIPENPRQELAITLAGPLVNVAIALVLVLPGFGLTFSLRPWSEEFWPLFPPLSVAELFETILRVNIIMVAFNLIPAFPMDGGRILRALLATVMRYGRATSLAVGVGQAIAVVFFIVGIWKVILVLPIIGFFIFWGAEMEERMVRMREALRELEVEDVMNRRFAVADPTEPLAHCLQRLYQTGQEDFPVVEDGRLVGLLTRRDLLRGFHEQGPGAPVAAAMRRAFRVVSPRTRLHKAHEEMLADDHAVFPVMSEGDLVGLLSRENISRYLLLADELERGRERRL